MNGAAATWELPDRGRVGMWSLIVAETAMFTIFVVAYLYNLGKSLSGPTPREVLEIPVVMTVCLLSSSVTIHLAVRALKRCVVSSFKMWWAATFVLGAAFLIGTLVEWRRLIYHEGLTIQTNLFGTTYYSLVGLHAFHVTVGLVLIAFVLAFAVLGYLDRAQAERAEILAMYWHFVDAVWVVVFLVVYVIGR